MSIDDRDYRRGYHQAIVMVWEALAHSGTKDFSQDLKDFKAEIDKYEKRVSSWRAKNDDHLVIEPPVLGEFHCQAAEWPHGGSAVAVQEWDYKVYGVGGHPQSENFLEEGE